MKFCNQKKMITIFLDSCIDCQNIKQKIELTNVTFLLISNWARNQSRLAEKNITTSSIHYTEGIYRQYLLPECSYSLQIKRYLTMSPSLSKISPTVMLCLLISTLIALCYAANNNSSGKTSGNKVSSPLSLRFPVNKCVWQNGV